MITLISLPALAGSGTTVASSILASQSPSQYLHLAACACVASATSRATTSVSARDIAIFVAIKSTLPQPSLVPARARLPSPLSPLPLELRFLFPSPSGVMQKSALVSRVRYTNDFYRVDFPVKMPQKNTHKVRVAEPAAWEEVAPNFLILYRPRVLSWLSLPSAVSPWRLAPDWIWCPCPRSAFLPTVVRTPTS